MPAPSATQVTRLATFGGSSMPWASFAGKVSAASALTASPIWTVVGDKRILTVVGDKRILTVTRGSE